MERADRTKKDEGAEQQHFRVSVQNIRPVTVNSSKTRAFCDVQIQLPSGLGVLTICGFSIVENGKGPWVGFPQRKGDRTWFPIVKSDGRIRDLICCAILDAYEVLRS